MATGTRVGLRRDASRNRAAILKAARELFSDTADVPMCQIALRAGVSQGTLYRNFANRSELIAEILDERVDQIVEVADEHLGELDAIYPLLRRLIHEVAHLSSFLLLAGRASPDDPLLTDSKRRIAEVLQTPLLDAKSHGIVRQDVTVDDIFLLLAMARGGMAELADPIARAATADRILSLLLVGIEAPGGDRPARG